MSDMEPESIAGVPFTSYEPADHALQKELADQKAELEGLGVSVTAISIAEPDSPPRFRIAFKPGVPSFKVRIAIEKEGWDIGQQMGDKMLVFYAAKRAIKTDGWNV